MEATATSRLARPHGKRFGSLVHAILAVIDLAAAPEAVLGVARAQGRLLGASDEDVQAAVVAVSAALEHDVIARARAAVEVRRECPVMARSSDGALIEGVLDLAYFDGTAWTVVDYKTDVAVEGRLAHYEVQIQAYVDAVARATGRSTVGVLLSV
jgi:ATP-dependent exoDNAse (exonuclease V) beta subunit